MSVTCGKLGSYCAVLIFTGGVSKCDRNHIVNINGMEELFMNILIAADYSTPKSGNFIASILALGRRLRVSGERVVFVFPKRVDSLV